MRRKNFKGRCEKRVIDKCKEVCRTYDDIQYKFADYLSQNSKIKEIMCNVVLEDIEKGEYTTDFVCIKNNNELLVRECVFRKYLTKPMTIELLELSRQYWLRRGVNDWGVVVEKE